MERVIYVMHQEIAPWWMRMFGRKYRTFKIPVRIEL